MHHFPPLLNNLLIISLLLSHLFIDCADQSFDHLSPSLIGLELHIINNNILVDNLPPSLHHLILSETFNLPVDHLPSSLHSLYFGNDFNQSVDYLPSSLQYLSFGIRFNQPVDHLPSSLCYLSFGQFCNQSTFQIQSSVSILFLLLVK